MTYNSWINLSLFYNYKFAHTSLYKWIFFIIKLKLVMATQISTRLFSGFNWNLRKWTVWLYATELVHLISRCRVDLLVRMLEKFLFDLSFSHKLSHTLICLFFILPHIRLKRHSHYVCWVGKQRCYPHRCGICTCKYIFGLDPFCVPKYIFGLDPFWVTKKVIRPAYFV